MSVTGVEFWRRMALRRRHLDFPNERSSHTQPTPRGGGVIIFLVTFAFLVFGGWKNGNLREILPFLAGAVLIAIVSWIDDLRSLPSLLRFAVHSIAAFVVIWGIGYFKAIEIGFATVNFDFLFFGQLFTWLWIVGLTNAYNFMDGIDGIAGTQGLTAGIGWCLFGFLTQQPFIFLFGGLLAAASLGFLWHNWHPARIFMGDVGSAFFGYSLAVLPLLMMKEKGEQGNWAVIGLLLVWTFVFDTVLTVVRRTLRRENIFAAHRSHLYQRLVIAGFRHDTVTMIYGVLSAAGIVWGWLYLTQSQITLAAFLVIAVFAVSLWLFVNGIEAKKIKKPLMLDNFFCKSLNRYLKQRNID